MIKLKKSVVLEEEYTLGQLSVYREKGYDFSLRSDPETRAFCLKLVNVPENVSLEELQDTLKDLGVYEADVFVDGQPRRLSRVKWAAAWRVTG